jgi:hypothetical protein
VDYAVLLSPEDNLRHALLSSSVCDDVMTPVILLIWSELVFSCLLWEELSVAQQVFGDHLRLDDTVELARFYRECPGRKAFESALAKHPCQISGRPNEAEAIPRIRAALAA